MTRYSKRLCFSGTLAALLLGAIAVTASAQVPTSRPGSTTKFHTFTNGLPNRWVVGVSLGSLGPKERPAAVAQAAQALRQQYGGTVRRSLRSAPAFVFEANGNVAQRLSDDPRVTLVEQEQPAVLATTQFSPTWNLDRIDQASGSLDSSYTYFATGYGVQAYIIDTGIRTSHNDFGGRADVVADEVGDSYNGQDCVGHGTHVAGILGGSTYGVAKGVSLHSVRVFNCSSASSTGQILAGIDDAITDRDTNHSGSPAVINMSLTTGSSYFLTLYVQAALNDGIVVVAAAGNFSDDAANYAPANISGVMAVGASDQYDQAAYFSDSGSTVSVFAPGVDVTSDFNGSDSDTATLSGTSMASPHVAGVIALYLEIQPSTTPAGVDYLVRIMGTAGVLNLSGMLSGTPNILLRSLGTPIFSYQGTDILYGGQGLLNNQALQSEDHSYQLAFQFDGNLVLMDYWYNPIWWTNTDGTGAAYANMQEDGNFVIYDYSYNPLFWTNTDGNSGALLKVQDDSNVVVYNVSWIPLWAWFGM